MTRPAPIAFGFVLLMAFAPSPARAVPPFSGTIFIDPDIITESDPTTFLGAGSGLRSGGN